MKKVLKFLRDNKVFYLATVSNNEPKIRPLGFVMEFGEKLYFGVGELKEVCKQIQANPNIAITCYSGGDGRWLRLSGKAVFDMRPEVFEAALKTMPMLKELYGDLEGPKLCTFYINDGQATFYDLQGNSSTISL